MGQHLGMVVLASQGSVLHTLFQVLEDLRGSGNFASFNWLGDRPSERSRVEIEAAPYQEILRRARKFLHINAADLSITVVRADTVEAARRHLVDLALEDSQFSVGVCIADTTSTALCTLGSDALEAEIDGLYIDDANNPVPSIRSPYSDLVFFPPDQPLKATIAGSISQLERVIPDEQWVLQAEILEFVTDYLDQTFLNKGARRRIRGSDFNPLGAELVKFLHNRAGTNWNYFYYPGSIVSDLIKQLAKETAALGVPCLRGANEHSLACGASANWRLGKKPFLIVATTGMSDEFKGTLMGLRQVRAKGFIVLGEYRTGKWMGFQGSITHDEDLREVLNARRIPWVYLDDKDGVAQQLTEAFRLYEAERGPVMILVTQQILEISQESFGELSYPCKPVPDDNISAELNKSIQATLQVINQEQSDVLWICGSLSQDERALVYAIAGKAGIGLADSIINPGSVSCYDQGKPMPNYLGCTGIYGMGRSVYSFMHEGSKLKPSDQLLVFFLKSRISMGEHPFSDATLSNKLRIAQLTERKEDIAPFADLPIVGTLQSFLEQIERRLDVKPEILQRRLISLEQARNTPNDICSMIPCTPMTPNYFFSRLNKVVRQLIESCAYEYIGVYDVGRCGLSAMRNVAQTTPGFSGWYGRSLMGDALAALPHLAMNHLDRNIVAFIGDGAKQIVPDILPGLIENLSGGKKFVGNITIFFILNNQLSILNTYGETVRVRQAKRHMRTLNLYPTQLDFEVDGLAIRNRYLTSFDESCIRESLTSKATVNLISVRIAHNNVGDGLTSSLEDSWQYL